MASYKIWPQSQEEKKTRLVHSMYNEAKKKFSHNSKFMGQQAHTWMNLHTHSYKVPTKIINQTGLNMKKGRVHWKSQLICILLIQGEKLVCQSVEASTVMNSVKIRQRQYYTAWQEDPGKQTVYPKINDKTVITACKITPGRFAHCSLSPVSRFHRWSFK